MNASLVLKLNVVLPAQALETDPDTEALFMLTLAVTSFFYKAKEAAMPSFDIDA